MNVYRINKYFVLLWLLLIFIISNPVCLAQPSQATAVPGRISYDYKNKVWSFYDIPSVAKAISEETGTLLAVGNVLGSENIKIGQSISEFTVEETHYDPSGSGETIYKGLIVFSWPSANRQATLEDLTTPVGYARAINQKRIAGSKKYEIFHYWPMGR